MVYECKPCNMKFENEYDFENHQKKFCINSQYAKVDTLDEIYQTNKLALRNQDPKELQNNYAYEPLKYQNKYNTPNQKNLTNSQYELQLKQNNKNYGNYKNFNNHDENQQYTSNGSGLQKTGNQLLGKMQINLQNQIEVLDKLKEDRARNNLNYEDSFLDELILMKDNMTLKYEEDIKQIKLKIVETENKLKQEPDEYDNLRRFLQELTKLLNYRETLRADEFALVKDYEEFQKVKLQNLQRKQIVADMKVYREENEVSEKQHVAELKNRKQKLEERRQQIMNKINSLDNRPISQADSVVSMYQDKAPSRHGRIPSRRNDFDQFNNRQGDISYYNNGRQEKSPHSPKNNYYQYNQRDRLKSAGQQLTQNNNSNNYNYNQNQIQTNEFKQKQDQKEINIYIPQNQNLNPVVEHNNQQHKVGFINQQSNNQQHIQQNNKNIDNDNEEEEEEEEEKHPFQNLAPNREFLAQNQPDNQSLSKEQRLLNKLQQEDVDLLRIISCLPVGSELYRFKMEQYKEQSALKTEIQKIVLEQQLQRSKRVYQDQQRERDRQEENERWIDDQRKFLIAQSIRKY